MKLPRGDEAPALGGTYPSEPHPGGSLNLYEALGIREGDVVAFVGAGGKSSAILRVAAELGEMGSKVLVAPTTKMFVSEAGSIGSVLISEDRDLLCAKIAETLSEGGTAVAGSSMLSKKRIGGIEPSWFPDLAPGDGVTLVEADGARRRPLKAPARHEPLLPEGVTLVVAVGGVHALGEPVDEEHVHRPEVFSELTGVGQGHTIDANAFARALLAALRNAPGSARRAALLSGTEPGRSMSEAATIARALWRSNTRNVVLTSLPKESPGQVWTL